MKRILIADDEPQLRILLNATLSQSGVDLIEAANGTQAWDLIEEHRPDLVILDWMMPKKTGIEVAELMQGKPETAKIPVIMLTARGMQSDHSIAQIAGIRDYMVKPFSPLSLLALVKATLAGQDPA